MKSELFARKAPRDRPDSGAGDRVDIAPRSRTGRRAMPRPTRANSDSADTAIDRVDTTSLAPETLSPFFGRIVTMVDSGELERGLTYRFPLAEDEGGGTLVLSIRGRDTSSTSQAIQPCSGGLAPFQLRKVLGYIRQNISSSISLSTLAQTAGLSPSHFSRSFKASVGRTPHAQIIRLRIERAMEMIVQTDEPLSQIAIACGLSDQAHLSRLFRRLTGTSPSRWHRARCDRGREAPH